MPESDDFWDFYWEMRLQAMETLGKREAVLAASRLVRQISQQNPRLVRMLELGCGEAQIIGALAEGHAQVSDVRGSVGVDYNAQSLARARKDYPSLRFIEGDFTDPALLIGLGEFDLVLLVNALHEVFSATFSSELGEVDVPAAKRRVEEAFAGAVSCLAPGGWLVLFDGIEPPGEPRELVRVRFLSEQARADFDVFAREFKPFNITYREGKDRLRISLPRRDFVRYIDKSIFLGKALWETERLESYQYFTESEFRAAFARQNLEIRELRTLTVNEEKWRRQIALEPPGTPFPHEHVLILAKRK